MGFNAPSGPDHWGIATNWTREIPVLSTLGWMTNKVRNGVTSLIGSKHVEKGLQTLI